MNKIVYFIGGYPNSGKTTLINHLSTHYKCEAFSGSKILHQKHKEIFGHDLNCKVPKNREKFINWVEGTYIPSLGGREPFIQSLMAQVANSKSEVVLVESIGGEEFDQMVGHLDWRVPFQTYNCTRYEETPGLDMRKPLPGDYINCNINIDHFMVKKLFPELKLRLLLPVPDCIAKRLGHKFVGTYLEQNRIICATSGQFFGLGRDFSAHILESLVSCGANKYEWGEGDLVVKSSSLKVTGTAVAAGADFFPGYRSALPFFNRAAPADLKKDLIF